MQNERDAPHIFPALIPSFPTIKYETPQPLVESAIKRIEFPIIPSALSSPTSRATKDEKTPRKKVAAQTEQWLALPREYFIPQTQRELLSDIINKREHANSSAVYILLDHIKTKISGYKAQDVAKMKYSVDMFVQLEDAVELLAESELKCYYCREDVKLFYEYVRDPKQWSLERMNNEIGHNRENLVIACLTCNIRRRTMHQERYVATKQMRVRKLE